MKNKSLSFNVNVEDIRALTANALTAIVVRYNTNQTNATKKITKALNEYTNKEILEALKELLEYNQQLIDEVNNLSGLIYAIEPLEPKTEILKDLPNLEEDSLGVGSGSE